MSAIQNHVDDDEFDLLGPILVLWASRWLIVAIVSLCLIGGLAYGLLVPKRYQARVVLFPTNNKAVPSGLGQFSGLASLAGINIGGGGNTQEPIAVLRSRDFARDFIDEEDLASILLSGGWGAKYGLWRSAERRPDIPKAVEHFDKDIRSVAEDKRTGLVTLSITWEDPVVSAQWANALVNRLNDSMRSRALAEAERNIKYLQSQLGTTSVTSLQQSISKVMESEMQKLLLARGEEEFAFKVIDRATAPRKSVTSITAVVFLSLVIGGLVSVAVVFVRRSVGRRRMASGALSQL